MFHPAIEQPVRYYNTCSGSGRFLPRFNIRELKLPKSSEGRLISYLFVVKAKARASCGITSGYSKNSSTI